MSTKIVNTGYTPRPLQAKLHQELIKYRFAVIVAHRRFGKTVTCINELIDRSLRNTKRNPQYAYIAPTYGQAKKVAWQYLKDYTQHFPGYQPNEQELRVTYQAPHNNGKITIMLLGAESADNLRGIYLDGLILDEYADMHPDAWSLVLRPALSDRRGWAIFIGTPKGHNDFKEKYDKALKSENWYAIVFRASETGILPQEELDAALEDMGEEAFMQEYECSWTSVLSGAYYSKQVDQARKDKRIRSVPYDPALLVDTFWDLGIGDTTVIWFRQQLGNNYHYIDYYEMSSEDIPHYVKILKEKPYVYGRHVLPHDGAARSLDTGRSRQESFMQLGIRTEIQQRHRIADQINAARLVIPKSYFDEVKCARGINSLEQYQRKWDAKNKIYMEQPLHNWASHGASAFAVSAMDSRDTNQMKINKLQTRADNDYNEFEY